MGLQSQIPSPVAGGTRPTVPCQDQLLARFAVMLGACLMFFASVGGASRRREPLTSDCERREEGSCLGSDAASKKSGPVCLSSPNRATESAESCKLAASNRTGFEARRRRKARRGERRSRKATLASPRVRQAGVGAVCRAAGCSARASELSNLAPRLRPARRTVAGWCPDVCELVWGEPGTFVKKRRVRRKHPLYWRISWGALTLEVGKSPTEVPPGTRLPVIIIKNLRCPRVSELLQV